MLSQRFRFRLKVSLRHMLMRPPLCFVFMPFGQKPELAVLAKDEVGDALAAVREAWEPEATARNLSLIRKGREARKNAEPWMTQI
jgi:hypothetical protein